MKCYEDIQHCFSRRDCATPSHYALYNIWTNAKVTHVPSLCYLTCAYMYMGRAHVILVGYVRHTRLLALHSLSKNTGRLALNR